MALQSDDAGELTNLIEFNAVCSVLLENDSSIQSWKAAVRYLGIEVDDALSLSEQVEI